MGMWFYHAWHCHAGTCVLGWMANELCAIHKNHKCHPQQLLNSSAVYIKHNDHLTTSNKANISRTCLGIALDFSRRLADTENKILSSTNESTQNIHIMDHMNEQWPLLAAQDKLYNTAIQAMYQFWELQKSKRNPCSFMSIVQLQFIFKQKKRFFFLNFLMCLSTKHFPILFFFKLVGKTGIQKSFYLYI